MICSTDTVGRPRAPRGKMSESQIALLVSAVSAVAAVASAIFAHSATKTASSVHESQKLLSQRQFLAQLWQYMAALKKINPAAPIVPDVVAVVNTLELVALCCEAGMVDEALIKRTFWDGYIEHYEQIEQVPLMPSLGTTGRQLLNENPAAQGFYQKLKTAKISRGAIDNKP